MGEFKKALLGAVFATAAAVGAAQAAPTIFAQVLPAVPPAVVPFGIEDFSNSAAPGNQTPADGSLLLSSGTVVSWTGDAGVYAGDVANITRSPFRGDPTEGYLVSQPNGTLTLTFATLQTGLNLFWGSVDTYNSLQLVFSGGGGTQVITGTDIANAASPPGSVSFGTSDVAVQLGSLNAFDTVQVISTQSAFEFVPGTPVPEPASLALFGTALLGLGVARRRRRVG